MSKFSEVVQPFLLCCDWLFEFFLLCVVVQNSAITDSNSAITAELLFLETNQNVGVTSDFNRNTTQKTEQQPRKPLPQPLIRPMSN